MTQYFSKNKKIFFSHHTYSTEKLYKTGIDLILRDNAERGFTEFQFFEIVY